jgi:hypothetical protein
VSGVIRTVSFSASDELASPVVARAPEQSGRRGARVPPVRALCVRFEVSMATPIRGVQSPEVVCLGTLNEHGR